MSEWGWCALWALLIVTLIAVGRVRGLQRELYESSIAHARTIGELEAVLAQLKAVQNDPTGHGGCAPMLRLRPQAAAGVVQASGKGWQDGIAQEGQSLSRVQAAVGQRPPGEAPGGGGGESGPWVTAASVEAPGGDLRPVPVSDDLGRVPRGSHRGDR